jgi:hypothetical protein
MTCFLKIFQNHRGSLSSDKEWSDGVDELQPIYFCSNSSVKK